MGKSTEVQKQKEQPRCPQGVRQTQRHEEPQWAGEGPQRPHCGVCMPLCGLWGMTGPQDGVEQSHWGESGEDRQTGGGDVERATPGPGTRQEGSCFPAQPSSLPCGHPSPTRAAVRVTQAICLMGPPADGRLDSPENETRTRCVGGAPVSEAALCSVVLPARCCLSG